MILRIQMRMLCMWMKDRIILFKHILNLLFLQWYLLLKILLLLPKLKEHRNSKDETWIEDPRLPLQKGPLQPPLMELLNSFPLSYLTHRHRALACQLHQTLALNCCKIPYPLYPSSLPAIEPRKS